LVQVVLVDTAMDQLVEEHLLALSMLLAVVAEDKLTQTELLEVLALEAGVEDVTHQKMLELMHLLVALYFMQLVAVVLLVILNMLHTLQLLVEQVIQAVEAEHQKVLVVALLLAVLAVLVTLQAAEAVLVSATHQVLL
jgi:hypothetical protein